MSKTIETTTVPCAVCAKPVARDKAPDLTGRWAVLAASIEPTCDECVAAQEAQWDEENRQAQEEARGRRRDARLKESGLPAKYHNLTLDGLDRPAEVLEAARCWALEGGGLLLSGEVGTGKTTLAGTAAWLRLQESFVAWTSAPLLFARLGSGFGSEPHDWAVGILSSKYGLVLDDIDKARPTEYGAEQVFLAIDQRIEHEAPLLVTSNLAPSQLAEKWPSPYGDAIASRLVGYCRVFRVEGVDRRLSGGAR